MRRFSNIDNLFVLNYGLTIQEAVVLEWMIQLPSWAKSKTFGDKLFFFASKNKAVEDLQVITDKRDTMYRYYKKLSEKGFIWIKKHEGKDYIYLLDITKQWNKMNLRPKDSELEVENNWKGSDSNPNTDEDQKESDNHPNKSGQSSEFNTDDCPTIQQLDNSLNNIVDKDKTLFGDSVQEISFLPDDILNHLNVELQKKFPKKRGFGPVASNLKDIKARLNDKKVKYSLQDFKSVIEFKIDKWYGKEKTKTWLRPSTLFGEKFDQYLTEALASNENGGNWGKQQLC